MRSDQLIITTLAAFVGSTAADFIIGKYSGEQVDRTFSNPTQDNLAGTWISTGIPGQENGFDKSKFCDAGTSANAADKKWDDWQNNDFCDLVIPGCPDSVRIVRAAGSFSGDCGANATGKGNPNYQGDYGVLIDLVTSPDAAIGNCYYGEGRIYQECHSTGTVDYNAEVLCRTGACGGSFNGENPF